MAENQSDTSTQQTLLYDPNEPPGDPQYPTPESGYEQTRRRRGRREIRQVLAEVVLPFAIGIVAAVVFLVVLTNLPERGGIGWLQQKMMLKETGEAASAVWIPYLCTLLFFWHIAICTVRYLRVVRPELMVLQRSNLIPPGGDEITDEELADVAQRAAQLEDAGGSLLSKRALLAVAHLEIKRDTAEMGDLLRRRADADRMRAANAYAVPRYIFWAIPILGFVGTVMGISGAVPMIGELMNDGSATKEVLGQVAESIGVAFNTTLIALLMSIPIWLLQTLVQQREAGMLADVEDYLTYRLQSRIRSDSPLASLEQTFLQFQNDQREQSRMTLQALMTSQDSLRESLSAIPQTLSEAGATNTRLLTDTQQQMQDVVKALQESMTQGFQMMIESGLGDRIQDVAARFNEEMTRIAETAGATLESSSERIVTSMSTAGNDFANSVDQLLDRFRETLDQGQELLQLQDTLQNNMERLEQVHHLDQTFSDMRASLHALHPVLARLQDPVPVRLILDGVDLPDAGEDGLAVHAGGNGAGNGNGERTGDAAAGETDKPVGS